MDLDDRVRDTLPVNQPYDGVVAEAYDVWLPPDGRYLDRTVFRDLIRGGDGPALELGCGNGRLLIGYRVEGLDVDGVDSAADMLTHCRAHADREGVPVTLHHADWLTLALDRRYATIYNPAGSFALIDDEDDGRRAVLAWAAHLRPGGRLVIAMGAGGDPTEGPRDEPWTWRLRRSATRADGTTFMVHQATRTGRDRRFTQSLDRHEVWGPDGTLRTTVMRRHRLRWWTAAELTDACTAAGLVDVDIVGDETAFLAVAHAPA